MMKGPIMKTDDEAYHPIKRFRIIEMQICGFATKSIFEHKPERSLGIDVRWERSHNTLSANGGVFSERERHAPEVFEVVQENSIR